ncbi:MAG TPA: tetratricopeptide repeat protein, partial [Bryobacteraceae bacterium]|nr:tetratricopeptide repeat protein [Bryobacteraceae bacterium]
MMRAISAAVLAAVAAAQTDPLVSGLEAFHRGDYVVAEREFRSSLKQNPGVRARVFLALTLAATNRCAEAERDLRSALESAPGETPRLAGIALAQCCLTGNRLEEAAAVVAKLKTRYPDDAD